MIIAIDGPAASGKSTTARGVARKLDMTYLDTGAMYRTVTLSVIENGIDPSEKEAMTNLLQSLNMDVSTQDGNTIITLNGKDVSKRIRLSDVTEKVSEVSALPVVREAMVSIQRELGRRTDCVVEGRDIGTVVFPEADYKFFLLAGVETRARRRQFDLKEMGESRSLEGLMQDLKDRDNLDSSRSHSPLRKAEDAVEINTGDLTIDEQINIIVDRVQQETK